MANGNGNLHASRAGKQDEFYTKKEVVEAELKHYEQHFEGKTVFCNCDNPYESEFFRYFFRFFNRFKLKKLIATSYANSPFSGTQISLFEDPTPPPSPPSYKIIITDTQGILVDNKTKMKKLLDDSATEIFGNGEYLAGDFRSDDCVELLREADIVVTNPPFSLFREYMAQLIAYEKKFVIIGNINAVSCNDIFPLIQSNRVWLGCNSGHFWFKVPNHYEEKPTDFKIDESGQKWRRMGGICWYTNLDVQKRHDKFPMQIKYAADKYKKYDGYDVIEVSETKNIPEGYYGAMGVPLTFLDKYNPDEFEILGIANSGRWQGYECLAVLDGRKIYQRLIIRRKGGV